LRHEFPIGNLSDDLKLEGQEQSMMPFAVPLRSAVVIICIAALTSGCRHAESHAPSGTQSFPAALDENRQILLKEQAALSGALGEPLFSSYGVAYQPDPLDSLETVVIRQPSFERLVIGDEKIESALIQAGLTAGLESGLQLTGIDDSGALMFADGLLNRYRFDLTTGSAVPVVTSGRECEGPRLISDQFPTTFGNMYEAQAPSTCRFITSRDGNLLVRDGRNQDTIALTTDGSPSLIWGGSEESSPRLNAFWSPDESWIAAILLDERNVPREPVLQYDTRRPEVAYLPYPRSGEPLQSFSVHSFELETGRRVDFDLLASGDAYVNIVGWLPSQKGFLVQVTSRDHKTFEVYLADPVTGKVRRILTHETDTYFDTLYTLGTAPVTILPPVSGELGDSFVLISNQEGSRALYLYSSKGDLVGRLTDNTVEVHSVLSVSPSTGELIVIASVDPERPYDHHLVGVSPFTGELRRLTPETGHHKVWLAPDGGSFVARVSTPERVPEVSLYSMDGRKVAVVSKADVSALNELGFAGMEEVWHKSLDGRFDVRGVILKPFNFDPSKRYPVVEMIYGGMQWARTPKTFYGYDDLSNGYNSIPARLLSHHGFVVVFVDTPGTPGRGKPFQDATYGIWPQTVMDDHAHWLTQSAATRPWMDLGRVGIYGNSWGGYMSVRALIDQPALYTAAIAMSAPQDFEDHPAYIEPFMGQPAQNPEGYAAASNFAGLDRIISPVLAISFPMDINAGYSPFMKFADAMVRSGKEIEMFTLPGINHRITCCGLDRENYVYTLMTDFFRRRLMPTSTP
jgi:dipeptidyl aminopeptidase/acylaminoacyl peptidase